MFNVGIDIAKRGHVAAVVDANGKLLVESFKFNNTADGFAKLLSRLEQAGVSGEAALVGMEATGHYWIALYDFLCSRGYKVAVINPIQTRRVPQGGDGAQGQDRRGGRGADRRSCALQGV